MKAALEAWGADSNLFHQGAAKESDDPDVIAATMAKPGVVLKRPVGSNGPFAEHAGLPTELGDERPKGRGRAPTQRKSAKRKKRTKDAATDIKAALAYDREERRRAREREQDEVAREKERERRRAAIEIIETKARREDRRWDGERAKLETALRRAEE
jgi:hypothetical protein